MVVDFLIKKIITSLFRKRNNAFEEKVMLKLPVKLKLSIISVLYGVMITFPAVADDIEIYTSAGLSSSTAQANILLVLDTSSSMATQIEGRAPYDPTIDYSGGAGCFDNSNVYTLPVSVFYASYFCGTGTLDTTYLGVVNRPSVVCDAASSLEVTGYYLGRVSQNRSGWQDDITNNNVTDFVECEVDNGVHGQITGDSNVWASSNNGPWSIDSADSIDWGSVGLSTVLYSGNYLNYFIVSEDTIVTRLSVMQDVITSLLNSISGVNVGLMRFSENWEGGMVVGAMDDIDTNRDSLIAALDAMTARGSTPLSETYYEAAMYYQGNDVDYGLTSTPIESVPESRIGDLYKSPILEECQKNYVVLLTDGNPVADYLSSTRLNKLNIDSCVGNCLDEIAKSIGTNDQSSVVRRDQFVSTYTIGFTTDQQLLLDTAKESFLATGAGEYYTADAATLTDAFNNIFVSINETNTMFSSPATSVNTLNRATHINDLFFTLFKPSIGTHWPGNFKKYKLDFFVDVNDVDNDDDTTERLPFIADKVGANAIDDITGFFSSESQSYWSLNVDGADVLEGGAVNLFTNTRHVYTYTDTYIDANGVFRPQAASAALTATVNVVDKTNAALDDVMLDIVGLPDEIPGTPRRQTLLDWAKGLDVFDQYGETGSTTDARLEMGDPLHSEPALVQYGESATGVPDLVSYVATNDGYLHAIDTDDGTEIFSFIPQELLPNLNILMENTSTSKTYGLDGNVVAWVNDANNDGTISGSDEHVYLYIGMRRGGKNIYSLDVTDRNNPTLRWVIKGGFGDYAEMGQTWSTVNVEKIKDGTAEKTVLIFGGGYDTKQDASTGITDDIGKAVYIADALSGELLWSAGRTGDTVVAEMNYSIPARIKPLDMRADGFIDRLYVADVGGQIFRFDINNKNGSALANSVTGGRIANLSQNSTSRRSRGADARRFYYPPDVALIAERGKQAYLALAVSSGYRAHPNNIRTHDRIYLLKDKNVYNIPDPYVTITEDDLYNATLNLAAGDGTDAQNDAAQLALSNTEGWYIYLDDETDAGNWIGEKGLAEALILKGTVIVTTYTPGEKTTADGCLPKPGTGKSFFMNVLDASPVITASTDKRDGRHLYGVTKGGIPPTPNVVVTKGEEPALCIGTQCMDADLLRGARRTYWYEVEK